ncbi:hypothetical protein Asi02nite_81680 [Asanoa siamensis]|uniref:Uncharacterized protein n=1 Tax=Asanoa siamensis TaxID=926357 RepID=A0ABQ4D535_9ACTN|nr:hypothetical protein Asi02nite_81680 [Asanoa siamensis]
MARRLVEAKGSEGVGLASPDWFVSVAMWDSGESEVITSSVAMNEDPRVSAQVLTDARAVAASVDRIVSELTARTE